MKIERYGFIVKGEGYEPQQHTATLSSSSFKTTVVGVESSEDALRVARDMAKSGVQVIELCGGFDSRDASNIMKDLKNKVPVGVVQFDAEALKLLSD